MCQWWLWLTPCGSSGGPNSKSCTCRSILYMLNNVPDTEFGFFSFLFVWTTTDCSLSFLVSLVGLKYCVWLFWVYGDDSVSDAGQSFRGSWSCPYSKHSGAIWWDVLLWSHLTHALIVLCPSHCSGSAWLLPPLCEILLCSPKNYHHQHHLGILILCHGRGSQNICSALLASIHSSRCFSFWRLRDSRPLSFSSSGLTVDHV